MMSITPQIDDQDRRIRLHVAAELRVLATALDGDAPKKFKQLLTRLTVFAKNLFRRLAIWIFSLAVAFYVPVHEEGIPLITANWTGNVMKDGKFTDVFLGVVAMVILSVTDIVDGMVLRRTKKVDTLTFGSGCVLLGIYVLFIFYGMPAYSGGQSATAPPWAVLWGMLALGVRGEVLVAKSSD